MDQAAEVDLAHGCAPCRIGPVQSRICWHMPDMEPPPLKARLFTNGRSQAVRLPKAMRFESEEVFIWREGNRVILEAVPQEAWPPGYWESLDALQEELRMEVEPWEPVLLDPEL